MSATSIPDPSLVKQELLAGCIRQDRLAQRQLYERYKKAMSSCAVCILYDRNLAQNALHNAFVDAFRNLAAFQQVAALGACIGPLWCAVPS